MNLLQDIKLILLQQGENLSSLSRRAGWSRQNIYSLTKEEVVSRKTLAKLHSILPELDISKWLIFYGHIPVEYLDLCKKDPYAVLDALDRA